jgi:hypothetical protein
LTNAGKHSPDNPHTFSRIENFGHDEDIRVYTISTMVNKSISTSIAMKLMAGHKDKEEKIREL